MLYVKLLSHNDSHSFTNSKNLESLKGLGLLEVNKHSIIQVKDKMINKAE